MRNEIRELSGGNEWRLFTSSFYDNYIHLGASRNDYLILCHLSEQILKNLFDIDCTVSDILKNLDIECRRNNRSKYRTDQYCMNFPIKTSSFFIEFSFELTKIDEYFVLGDCVFSVDDEYLLTKLPLGKNSNEASCRSWFTLNQVYSSTTVTYQQLVRHYESGRLLEDDCPTLLYEYDIRPDSIDLNFTYYYTDYNYSSGYSMESSKYFFNRYLYMDSKLLLKFSQFYKLIEYHSAQIDLTDEFPKITKQVLISPLETKPLLDNFLNSNVDVSDKVLLFEMAMI